MRTHITALYRGQIVSVPIADVTHFRSGEKYVTAYHSGGELIITDKLMNLEKELAADFIRVHRRTIVRRSLVAGMSKDWKNDYADLSLRGIADTLVVSRRRLAEVKAFINQGVTSCAS